MMGSTRLGRRALVAGGLLALSVFATHDAEADGAPKADVIVIHAATVPNAPSMDPKLAGLKQLKNVPFNGYNVFKVLDTKTLPLTKTGGPSIALANGYNFSLSLSSTEGKHLKIIPSLSRTATPNPLPEVSAKVGETFFVAGQSYQGGIIILAITPS